MAEPATPSSHLTFPTFVSEDDSAVASSSKLPTPQLDRLYVGNLHPSVDEYTLLQIFRKHGNVTKFDFLFHKTGLLKGKPRGYAFVEYGDKDDAQRAQTALNDKLLRGRKMVVTFAQNAPADALTPGKPRKMVTEAGRPTTLSMLKSGRSGGTDDKIARMEAKLQQMAQEDSPRPLLPHASLPAKPPPSSAPAALANEPQRVWRPPAALPVVPGRLKSTSEILGNSAITGGSTAKSKKSLAGVKLGKGKAKAEGPG
ncbi:Single-stranded nucleic acid binding protein [Mycena kentingensis (nom. inval.)]|nr:Single-stranded nucleic acid binding protein [Mycena kentingensis (nom. inval.)]